MEIFYILILVVVTQMSMFIKTHRTLYVKSVLILLYVNYASVNLTLKAKIKRRPQKYPERRDYFQINKTVEYFQCWRKITVFLGFYIQRNKGKDRHFQAKKRRVCYQDTLTKERIYCSQKESDAKWKIWDARMNE